MEDSHLSERPLAHPAFTHKVASILRNIFLSSFEMLPLMVFILIRAFETPMPTRILTGGVLAICVFALGRAVSFRVSPPYFATNIFFIFASTILLLPFPALSQFFLDLGEVGMFVTIFLVSVVWHFCKSNGVLDPCDTLPKYKFHSWCLLLVMALCPFIATFFKGNENLAGGLPFILIIIAERLLTYLQAKKIEGLKNA